MYVYYTWLIKVYVNEGKVAVDGVYQGIIRVHASQKNETVFFTSWTDVKMIPALVRAVAGHHAVQAVES